MKTLTKISLYLLAGFCILLISPIFILHVTAVWALTKLGKYDHKTDVQLKIDAPDGYMPYYATDGAACLDVMAYLPKIDFRTDNVIVIPPKTSAIIETGITVEIPKGYKIDFRSKSGLGFKFDIVGFDGVIDYDYRGKMKLKLFNLSDEAFIVEDKMRVAQMELVKVEKAKLVLCSASDMSQTQRGTGGFGSTGK